MNATQLNSLSLAELKKQAKGRRIKLYYIMPKQELVDLLSLAELPKDRVVEKLTILQLRAEAKVKGIRGFWNLSRGELVALLYPATPTLSEQQKEDRRDPNKHDSPNDSDPN